MSDLEMYLGAMAGSYEGELPPPNTRSLKWMAKILGADIVTEPVQSAEEAYLEAIYENGGGGVTVEALTVTENGTYTAEEGTAYSPVTVNVPTGANYVETIEGTLANPWGEYSAGDLNDSLAANDITLLIRFNMGQAWTRDFPIYEDLIVDFAETSSNSISSVFYISWDTAGVLTHANMFSSFTESTNMIQMAAYIPTILTIIHHPLPSGS